MTEPDSVELNRRLAELARLRQSVREMTKEQSDLRKRLFGLTTEWKRRARHADRAGMIQIAMDLRDCASELTRAMGQV